MEFLTTTTFAAMGLVFLGAFVQTSIGFGLAIVSAPLLFQLSPDYVPAPICLVALFISLMTARKLRSQVSVGGLKMALYGRVPGSIAGGALLLYVSVSTLSLWLGVMVLLAVLVSLMPFRLEPTPNRMLTAGFISGFMGTSSSIGGPPMALLLQHQDASSLRGNLSAFFVFSSIMSLIVQIPIGYFTLHHLYISLPLLPAAWLGYVLAQKVVHLVSSGIIRYVALALCLLSGVTAIWQGLN